MSRALRSLLFVPADRPERFDKAAASGADALILDLEDSVAAERKALGRQAIAAWLSEPREATVLVRVNPIDSPFHLADLSALSGVQPAGWLLPKAEGAASVERFVAALEAEGLPAHGILPIATETPAAIFGLGSYGAVADRLIGLTWGAEDLPAAIGAETSREADGSYTAPYQLARSLTLFGAHAAGVAAIDTVFPNFRDLDALSAYAQRAARDGFSGMMAIHPAQVPAINAAFTPDAAAVARAEAIVRAFETQPGVGALQLDGRMVDAPHLKAAQALLVRAAR